MKLLQFFKPTTYLFLVLIIVSGHWLTSCSKFVDLGSPKGSQDLETTFNDEGSATAAVLNLYSLYERDLGFAPATSGMAADIFETDDPMLAEFQNNNISIYNFYSGSYLWATYYFQIRRCNLILAGLTATTALPEALKNQLTGEALFFRSLMFFNLVNLYGDVPLTVSFNEGENAGLARSPSSDVWAQLVDDLKTAQSLLKPEYPSGQRARVNQHAATTLLARAYLYLEDWTNAELEADKVIKSGLYRLVDPVETFKNNSDETILQLYTPTGTSSMANLYLPFVSDQTPLFYLRSDFGRAFELASDGSDDLRLTHWVGVNDLGRQYMNKYKIPGGTGDEYTILLRFAELYLIRAEARAMQNNLQGTESSVSDLNFVRQRAGLMPLTTGNQPELRAWIEQERKVELFGEAAHRWFDLKRTPGFADPSTTRADEILSTLKGAFWSPDDQIFPIPADQIDLNPALGQNPGYIND